jgi:predicted  nucleic acid-binding Zn-ribbon protein
MTQTKAELNHVEMYEWLKALDFYKNELKFWRKHLSEVVSKNTTNHILREAEHFQNQVIIHEEHIDILRHDVKQFENHLGAELSSGSPISALTIHVEGQLRDRLRTFEHIYVDLKHEYYSFLRKYM